LNKRGALLLEAVLAIFLLLAAIILVGSLFQRTAQLRTAHKVLDAQIAFSEDLLDEIRLWALEPDNFNSDWSIWNGRVERDPNHAGVEATVRCDGAGQTLLSPSSELETSWDASIRRGLEKAVVRVQLTVTAPSQKDLVMVSYLEPPRQELVPDPVLSVTQTSGANPLDKDAEASFAASITDADGKPIPDLVYEWHLLPQTGNATLVKSTAPRNGSLATLRNRIVLPGGMVGYAPGEVRLLVRARYRGRYLDNGDPPSTVVNLL